MADPWLQWWMVKKKIFEALGMERNVELDIGGFWRYLLCLDIGLLLGT